MDANTNTRLRLIFSSLQDNHSVEQSRGSIKFTDNTPYNESGSKSSMTILYNTETKNSISSITLSGNYVGSDKTYNVSNLKFEHVEGPVFISVIDDTQPIIIGVLNASKIIAAMNETKNEGYGDTSPTITNYKGDLIIFKDIEIER